ncbi:hypothetical protein Btru_056802 [Bulinus truncatus]|nr:hypothetical protein Btru_056802 [Bulinus truncatus]
MISLKLFFVLSILCCGKTFPLTDCRSSDINIIFFIDCDFPVPGVEVKIRNILLNHFVTTTSNNSTRTLRVLVMDIFKELSGMNFVIIESIEEYDITFFNVCTPPSAKVKYETFYTDTSLYSSQEFIYIVQRKQYESGRIYAPPGSIVINIDNGKYPSNTLTHLIYANAKDDLSENNKLSVALCGHCSAGWLTLKNKDNDVTSCYLLQKQAKNVSWKDAANHCDDKKLHLATFEDFADFHLLSFKAFKTINVSPFSVLPVQIPIGLYTLRKNGHLIWVNGRPVSASIYNITNLPCRTYNSDQVCFRWQISYSGYSFIEHGSCTEMISTYIWCEQEVLFYEIEISNDKLTVIDSHSQIYAKDIFYNELFSISSSIYLNSLTMQTFPTFACNPDGGYISYHYVCDGFSDCSAGEDEEVYAFDTDSCQNTDIFICSTPGDNARYCVPMDARCNFIDDCPDGSDEWDCDDCVDAKCDNDVCIPNLWYFNCSLLVPHRLLYELFKDVRKIFNREINLKDLITFCDTSQQTHFVDMKIFNSILFKKFSWTPKCLYLKGKFGNRLGCPDMSHLSDCINFQCPSGFVKCSKSYCIPVYLVNDGVADCPHGEDEGYSPSRVMSYYNYFHCYDSKIRLHLLQVCDGLRQCPRGDDELNCISECHVGFFCMDDTATVDYSPIIVDFSQISPAVTYLNISGVDISLTYSTKNTFSFSKLLVFIASGCNITDVVIFRFIINSVYLVDVSFNQMTKLISRDFLSDFQKVYFMNISFNKHLSFIDEGYFQQFKYLKSLDLSFTKVTQVNVDFNSELTHLILQSTQLITLHLSQNSSFEIIDIRNSKFSSFIPERFFLNISISGKILADSGVCCPLFIGPKIPGNRCVSEVISVSTCDDLIGDSMKRVLLWIVAACSVIGNLTVLGYRIFFDRATLNMTYGSLVTCLSVSDLIMGFYLVIIGSVDLYYRHVYVANQNTWRQSTLCQISGVFATLSSETSTFLILLITFERYLTIKFPFGQYRFSKLTRNVCILFSWVLGLVVAMIPTLYQEMSLYSSSGMCLGFPLKRSTGHAWIYSVVIFLFLNSILFVLIACGQVAIFYMIYANNAKFKNSNQQPTRRADDIKVAEKLALVVVSNFICWFPVCVLGLRTVVSDFEVDRHTYSWIVAVVLPVNAALNPFLYTVPNIYRMWQDYKNSPRRMSTTSLRRTVWGNFNTGGPSGETLTQEDRLGEL